MRRVALLVAAVDRRACRRVPGAAKREIHRVAFSFANWQPFFDGWYDWNGHVSPIILSLAIAIAIIGFKQFSSQQLANDRE